MKGVMGIGFPEFGQKFVPTLKAQPMLIRASLVIMTFGRLAHLGELLTSSFKGGVRY